MIELFAFLSLILAAAAFLNGKRAAEGLNKRIDALRADVKRLQDPRAVEAPERGETVIKARDTVSEAQAAPIPLPNARPEEPEPAEPSPIHRHAVEEASAAETVPPATATDDVLQRRPESLENLLGARWAVWVGGVALALGGVFMVKYSIEAGLVSPAVRLTLATCFGFLLLAAGEAVRRRAVPTIARQFDNAMIPGILTAAGTVTLFGVTFAAHGIYGYIGPAPAFALLALISLATIGLSLLHGQALAGLGLLASLITPLLVTSTNPDIPTLLGFLAIAWLALLGAARIRRWVLVPALGNLGMGLWMIVCVLTAGPAHAWPVTATALLMLAAVAFLWPAGWAAPPVADLIGPPKRAGQGSPALPLPRTAVVTMTAAVAALLAALFIVSDGILPQSNAPLFEFGLIIAGLAALGAMRPASMSAGVIGAIGAITGLWLLASDKVFPVVTEAGRDAWSPATMVILAGMALSSIFLLCAAFALRRHRVHPGVAPTWAFLAAAVSFLLTAMTFLMLGNLVFDLAHGVFAAAAGLILLALAETNARRPDKAWDAGTGQAFLVCGAFALFALAVHALTDGLATTLLIALLGAVAVAATRARPWPILPWIMAGAAVILMVRIGVDPTIVGRAHLSKTPVFNALLPGYGIPALALALAAFELRQWPDARSRNLLQALASLFALLTAAILVRHAMNGGVLDGTVPTLGEQSIYTLLLIGASAIAMSLDLKAESPVFRYGGMALGAISMLAILVAHLLALNPYYTGELLGSVPVFDLLLLGYLIPGLGFAGLAFYARGKRPLAYVIALAVTACILALAFATLSVRRFWQGEGIARWKGFLQAETYTYSVVWLLIGVLLLALGSRFNARSIRLASAFLVFATVLKVFLIDMSNLEGFLRALSFIGLGAVLIGIGLFYQKILSTKGDHRFVAPPG